MKARSQVKPKRYRRYDSTGLSGTMPRPRVRHHAVDGKWIALVVIALLVVGAILWVWLSDTFYVTRIGVAGNALTPAQEIVQISGIGGHDPKSTKVIFDYTENYQFSRQRHREAHKTKFYLYLTFISVVRLSYCE